MSMAAYRRKVAAAAALRNGEPLYNGSVEHAAILTEALFENAQRSVSILTGDLDARVYGDRDVLDKARIFLSKNGRTIRVLVANDADIDERDHPFFREFCGDDGSDDVIVRRFRDGFDTPYHFTVADDDAYRYQEDQEVMRAVAAFGDRDNGGHLSKLFDTLWSDDYSRRQHGAEQRELDLED